MRASDLLLMRYTLATVWLVSGILSLGIFPQRESLDLLGHVGLHNDFALITLYGAASLDILLAILTIALPSLLLWQIQASLVVGYSVIITFFLPWFWLHPFGPVLKNLPILLLLWFLYKHGRKTS